MEIRFWGVRGSVPVPGVGTEGVGGNTSCIEVCAGGERIVLDAGTGLRCLGATLGGGPVSMTLMLSHLHWDHIQGIPFFGPLYSPGTRMRIVGAVEGDGTLEEALAQQMRPPQFPVDWRGVPAARSYRDLTPGETLEVGAVRVRSAGLNHPGGVLAYRVEHGGRSVVYATDTEHYDHVDPALEALARGADVLIYDAQYTPEEYLGVGGPGRVGWGHSTWRAAVEVARAAGVGQLVLHHHDPARSDEGVAEIEATAKRAFSRCRAAREGLVITLPEAHAAREERGGPADVRGAR
jgi:phosphoribosyl 1,2-cyclic phosphodiesterase